ncbi:hypothetical protein [Actinomadura bangladeshensis]|uniref:hypothetical protein n=1 Tax=Actinomadura bangladeshensis TaxID=453573 RepID=UPI001FB68214|nr:hypothetical protein [Actinomadura bangladeshensis]
MLGRLRTQPAGFEVAVAQATQGQFAAAEPEPDEGDGRDVIGGGVDAVEGVGQRRRLLGRRQQLDLHHQFHSP